METTKKKTSRKHKTKVPNIDAVKMMREIRDKISEETQNMSFDELKAYINKQLENSRTRLIGSWLFLGYPLSGQDAETILKWIQDDQAWPTHIAVYRTVGVQSSYAST